MAESWEWYEDRQRGLGDRFVKEVILRIGEIEKSPEKYPNRYKLYKETMVEIFPFLLIYKLNKKRSLIRIVSIFHTSRNPRKKYKA
jgi:hypothetical protein